MKNVEVADVLSWQDRSHAESRKEIRPQKGNPGGKKFYTRFKGGRLIEMDRPLDAFAMARAIKRYARRKGAINTRKARLTAAQKRFDLTTEKLRRLR